MPVYEDDDLKLRQIPKSSPIFQPLNARLEILKDFDDDEIYRVRMKGFRTSEQEGLTINMDLCDYMKDYITALNARPLTKVFE